MIDLFAYAILISAIHGRYRLPEMNGDIYVMNSLTCLMLRWHAFKWLCRTVGIFPLRSRILISLQARTAPMGSSLEMIIIG